MPTKQHTHFQETSGIIGIREVVSLTHLSETTIWRLEKRGDFPSRKRLSPGRIGWLTEEIQTWLLSRMNKFLTTKNEKGDKQ
jgi:prophage regulatory protein